MEKRDRNGWTVTLLVGENVKVYYFSVFVGQRQGFKTIVRSSFRPGL